MDWDGHGSHCAGTVAGNTGDLSASGTGMAPDAKLAIIDTYSKLEGGLVVGWQATYENVFAAMEVAVTSNSWGGDTGYYGRSRNMDQYAALNPSILAVFAAGNSGPSQGEAKARLDYI